jgi:cell division septal protein FtsQ
MHSYEKLPEQIAFDYTGQQESLSSRRARAGGRNNVNRDNARESRRRRVRPDQESVAPSTYAERRARYHRPQGQQYTVRAVSRTFAQTGIAAPDGLERSRRRLPPMHTPASSPIPPRSSRVRKRGFLRRVLGIFSVVALLGAAIGFALFSSSFRIQGVAVMGTTNPAVIHAIAHMNMVGQNIFLIDLPALTDQIEALPPVESANLQKVWPDQLVVNVVERLPVILWQTPQGIYSVDSHGVVIAPAGETSGPAHLMTVVDMRSKGVTQQVRPGTHLNAADIAFALQVFEQVPQVVGVTQFTLRYTVTGGPAPVGSFSIVSSQGWIAYLGSATDSNPLSNRLAELQQILKRAQQDQVTLATIDLQYGLRPVFTVKP